MSQAFPPLGPEYEPFLYAVVCDETNGAPLTMVSAIARSGADPWQEAARIARLPKSAAFEVLARLIPVSGEAENREIAKRLFALLPAAPPIRFVSSTARAGRSGLRSPFLIIIVLLLGLALVVAFWKTRQDGPQAQAQAPSAVSPVAGKAEP